MGRNDSTISAGTMKMTRRTVLGAAAMATGAALLPRSAMALAPPGKPLGGFEVSGSLYPWDLHDEGIEQIFDNLQSMAEVNSVYLLGIMHYEIRPFTSPHYTHNPVRMNWQAEDSRCYWHFDPAMYGRIKPVPSDFDFLRDTDWVRMFCIAARKRGLKVGVELSHTLVPLEFILNSYADCAQQNIHGVSHPVYARSYPLCPNSPDAQVYVKALFCDLAKHYDVDYLQTCMLPFMPGGAEKGGCFCPNCVKAAGGKNIDLKRIQAVLLQNPTAKPELQTWQKFREDSMVNFFRIMHDGIRAIKPRVDLRYNDCFPGTSTWGLDFSTLKNSIDSIRVCDYSEQKGDPAQMHNKTEWLTAERKATGRDFPMLSAIAVRPKGTPELIREGVKIAVDCGMDGITLGHYDGAEFPMLRAIRVGLDAKDVHPPAKLLLA
jgi:hypothetical protein